MRRRWAFALVPLFLLALPALARVGGGESYSGGGGGGGWSSSGGSDGAEGLVFELLWQLVRALFWLTWHHPVIGIPIDIFVIFAIYKFVTRDREWSISSSEDVRGLAPSFGGADQQARVQVPERLRELKQLDENFSRALFNDFSYALFAEVHKARGEGRLGSLSSYVSPEAAQRLMGVSPGAKSVDGIIVGSMTIEKVTRTDLPNVRITVKFKANYTEASASGKQTWYARERWTFVRSREAKSRPPEKILQIICPNCGAPPANNGRNACPSCGASNDTGRLAWLLEEWQGTREERPPLLTETAPEVGTRYPTLYDPDLKAAEKELFKEQPDFDWKRFETRARTIFLELQRAWSERRWERARPYETDAVFQMHSYWMNEYGKQSLRNQLSDVRITRFVPAKVEEDKYYSSITVRIFASMNDQVVSEQSGRVLCGGPRVFSEYWTFIRGRGTGARAKAKAQTGNDLACPSCGAALDKVNAAGVCEYCRAKITSGEFDWVLSLIAQDEEYAG